MSQTVAIWGRNATGRLQSEGGNEVVLMLGNCRQLASDTYAVYETLHETTRSELAFGGG